MQHIVETLNGADLIVIQEESCGYKLNILLSFILSFSISFLVFATANSASVLVCLERNIKVGQ